MTPPDRPADHDEGLDREPTDDELAVHAVLDGEATPAQRRRVAGDAALRAQVTEMKAVVDQVASPPKAPGDDVFEAIRAAAASHLGDPEEVLDLRDQVLDPDPGPDVDEDEDEERPEEEPDPTEPEPHLAAGADPEPADVVVPLDRTARRARRRWPALPAVAAAILVLVALGVGLIVTDGDDPQADFTAAGDAIEGDHSSDGAGGGSDEESSGDDAQREMEGSGAGSVPTTTAPGASSGDASDAPNGSDLVPQASFADDASLRDVLEEVDPSTLVLDPGPEGFEDARRAANLGRAEAAEVARCSAVIQSSDPDVGAAQAAVVVEVGGDTLLVLSSPVAATDSAPAAVLLHVLDPVSCVPRFAVQR